LTKSDVRYGCPVVNVDTSEERPAGGWIEELSALRRRAPILWNENCGFWILTRADLIREVFQNYEDFSSDNTIPQQSEQAVQFIPGNVAPPLHTAYRRVLQRRFGPGSVARIEPAMREYARQGIDAIYDRGQCEFMHDFGSIYPTQVFFHLVDLPYEEAPRFSTLSDDIFEGLYSEDDAGKERVVVGMNEIREYFVAAIAERRRSPRDPATDFLSEVMAGSIQDRPITDDEVLNIYNQLVLAGLDTVKSALGYSMWHLAQHPADRARLTAEPGLSTLAVEEFLRAFPLVMDGRRVARDLEFHGVPMKKGEMVMVCIPAGMRDPDAFEHPDEIMLDRPRNNHMTFGAGPHRCLGSHLARVEMKVALEEWHARIPDYALASDPDTIRERGSQLSLRSLPLRWDV
jgi:cytochrome P450